MQATAAIKDYRTLPGALSADRKSYNFPDVKSVNRNGKEMFWRIKVAVIAAEDSTDLPLDIAEEWFDNNKIAMPFVAVISVESGIAGGKIKDASPTYVRAGKNIGRANETNIFCQALRDALGRYNKHARGAIHEDNVDVMFPPMLASIYEPDKIAEDFKEQRQVFVQRKFNGIRAVICLPPGKTIMMYSRGNKTYGAWPELFAEVAPIFADEPKIYIDGEIYAEGTALQEISGKVRKGDYAGLTFYAYDVFYTDDQLVQHERVELLDALLGGLKNIKVADTYEVYDAEEIDKLYHRFLDEGYEGAMIRRDLPYVFSYNKYRSAALMKFKPSFDAEYKITGFTQGQKGKALGALMMICETDSGIRFDVTPAETIPERKKLYATFMADQARFDADWLGELLIVEYDELSADNVPQRARTKLLVRKGDDIIKIN